MYQVTKFAAAAIVVGSLMIGTASAQTVLRSSDTHPDGYPTVEAVKYFGELIEERTDGRYSVEVYHSAQLGEEADALQLLRYQQQPEDLANIVGNGKVVVEYTPLPNMIAGLVSRIERPLP